MIYLIEIITQFILYPLVVMFALHFAKESVKHPLNKGEKAAYYLCVISVLLQGVIK